MKSGNKSIVAVVNFAYSPVVFIVLLFCVIIKFVILYNDDLLAVSFIYFVELIFASTVIIFFIGNAMDHVRIKKRGHSSPRKHGQSSEGNPKQLIDRYLQRSDVRIKRDRP